MKKPNKAGTVYKLPGERRRPYIAKAYIEKNKYTGKPKYKTIGYYKEKKDADDALNEYRRNPHGPGNKITFEELYNNWKELAYQDIAKATQDNYRAAFKLFEPLHKRQFRDILKSEFTTTIRNTEKSRSTQAKMKTLAKQLSDFAQEERIIRPEENAANNIKLQKSEKKETEIFTEAEIEILKENDKDYWVQSILILIYTGLRIAEYLEAKTEKVDLEEKIMIAGKKTEAGTDRVIIIHDQILPYLKARMKNETLEEVNPDRYRRKHYYPTLDNLKIARKTPHACRHTCGTRLAEAGVNPIVIKQQLGHTDYAFTANKYTHIQKNFIEKELKAVK